MAELPEKLHETAWRRGAKVLLPALPMCRLISGSRRGCSFAQARMEYMVSQLPFVLVDGVVSIVGREPDSCSEAVFGRVSRRRDLRARGTAQ